MVLYFVVLKLQRQMIIEILENWESPGKIKPIGELDAQLKILSIMYFEKLQAQLRKHGKLCQ